MGLLSAQMSMVVRRKVLVEVAGKSLLAHSEPSTYQCFVVIYTHDRVQFLVRKETRGNRREYADGRRADELKITMRSEDRFAPAMPQRAILCNRNQAGGRWERPQRHCGALARNHQVLCAREMNMRTHAVTMPLASRLWQP